MLTLGFRVPLEVGHLQVIRIFCSVCGSQIAHKSECVKGGIAVQTGNFEDFAEIPITLEREWPVSRFEVKELTLVR